MKKLLIVFLLALLSSCVQEEIQSFNDLSPSEQDAIRQTSYLKCLAQYQIIYNRFKNTSNQVFDSTSYDREKGFYFEYKSGTEVKKKLDIRVWKRDGNADEIYFYITDTQIGSENYFLRVTRNQNESMIDDLLEDHCRKPSVYTSSTGESGPLSIKYEFERSNAPNTDVYTDTFSLPFSSLAVFANFRIGRKITTKNSSGETVGSAQNYTSSLVTKSYDFDGYTIPTDSTRYTQKFCNLVEENVVINGANTTAYRFSQVPSNLGFRLSCTEGTVPGDWNLIL